MRNLPVSPDFSIIEASIARIAKRMQDAPVQDIVLVRLIKHLSGQLDTHLGNIVRPIGINEVGFRALMMLYANEKQGVHPSQLSEASSESRANTTRICDELERKGLLRRRPSIEDRRCVVLQLTPRGERLIEKLLPKVWQGLDGFSNALNGQEKRELERLMKKIAAAMDDAR